MRFCALTGMVLMVFDHQRISSRLHRGVLRFATSQPGRLRVEVLDLAGRRVRRLMDETDAPPDVYLLTVGVRGADGGRLSPGVYFYRIESTDGVRMGRFVMLD